MSAAADLPTIDAEHPWPGLESYAEAARAWFHGRESEAAALFALVQREVLTVLYGRSGLGKTSLLQAGLSPLLREREYLPVRVHLILEDGAPHLTRQVADALIHEASASGVEAPLWPPGMGLWEYFHQATCDLWTANDRLLTPVLIFDQFEEIFTLGRESPERRIRCDQLLGEIGDLVEDRQPQALRAKLDADPEFAQPFDLRRPGPRVLLSFREDYLADFDVLHAYLRARTSNRFRLLPMDGATASTAAQSAGRSLVSTPVAERIVRFIDNRDRPLKDLIVEPALLSLVCRELNESRLLRGEAEISTALLLGDSTRRIIEAFYDEGFTDLDLGVRRFVEDRLLTTAGFRDSCALDNALASPGVSGTALDTLVERRILRREERGGQIRLELIHDVLAGVAKARRDARRDIEALAHARDQLGEQRRRQVIVSAAVILLLGILAAVTTLSFKTRQSLKATELAKREASTEAATAQAETHRAILAEQSAIRAAAEREVALRRAEAAKSLADATARDAARQSRFALSQLFAFEADKALNATVNGGFTKGTLLAIEAVSEAPEPYALKALMKARTRTEVRWVGFTSRNLISALDFSPDGKTLAGGGLDGSIRLWDLASRTMLGAPRLGHEGIVYSVVFSPDGRTLASAGQDGTLRLWKPDSGEALGEPFGGQSGIAYAVAFSPDGKTLASGNEDGTVRLWDVSSRMARGAALRGHDRDVYAVAFSPNGKALATGSVDGTVRLWDLSSQRSRGESLGGNGGVVYSVAFSPDGTALASGAQDGAVRLWDVASRQALGDPLRAHKEAGVTTIMRRGFFKLLIPSTAPSVQAHLDAERADEGATMSVVFSPDGKTLASGTDDGTVRLWDFASRQPLGEPLRGHSEEVFDVAFSPDSTTLASASADGTIRLWDLTNRMPLSLPLGRLPSAIASVAFSPDERVLASAAIDGTARLWDFASRRGLGKPLRGKIDSMAFSPDGRTLAGGSRGGTVRLWDVSDARELGDLPTGHTGIINSIAFSPDGKTLAGGGWDGTLSPDGTTLRGHGRDGALRLWDVASRRPIGELLGGAADTVNFVAFSPDGKTLASAGSDGIVHLWEVAGRRPLGELTGGTRRAIRSLAFSPNGKTLATAADGGIVRLWDLASRRSVGEPSQGHEGTAGAVAFSPDGSMLIIIGSDRRIHLWDVRNRRLLVDPIGELISSVAISPDGKTLVSGDMSGTVLLWDIDFKGWPQYLCDRLPRNLTRAEWRGFVGDAVSYHATCPNLPLPNDQ